MNITTSNSYPSFSTSDFKLFKSSPPGTCIVPTTIFLSFFSLVLEVEEQPIENTPSEIDKVNPSIFFNNDFFDTYNTPLI